MEKVIITDEQGEKVQGQYITIYVRVRDDLFKSLARYPAVSPDKPSNTKYTKGFKGCKWQPISMNDLKESKQAIVSYTLPSSFVREMVKMWTSSKKAVPQNWIQLVSEVLEDRPKLLCKCYWQKRQQFQNKREK